MCINMFNQKCQDVEWISQAQDFGIFMFSWHQAPVWATSPLASHPDKGSCSIGWHEENGCLIVIWTSRGTDFEVFQQIK